MTPERDTFTTTVEGAAAHAEMFTPSEEPAEVPSGEDLELIDRERRAWYERQREQDR